MISRAPGGRMAGIEMSDSSDQAAPRDSVDTETPASTPPAPPTVRVAPPDVGACLSSTDFDARHGTRTAGVLAPQHLQHVPEVEAQAVGYEATDPLSFRVLMRALPIHHPDYAFVDVGSGKGRVVLLAAEYPFRCVVGVEASPVLHRIALENLRVASRTRRRCDRVMLRNVDAAEYRLPRGALVLYLFNPFRERRMARLLVRLKASLDARPRDLWIVYYNPQLADQLQDCRFLARVAAGAGQSQGDWGIWRSWGAAAGGG